MVIKHCVVVLAVLLCFSNFGFSQKGIRLKKLVNKKTSSSTTIPLSVVEVPTGTFMMRVRNSLDNSQEEKKPVLISGFYISASEVTNAQYKEFVDWVRDSIAARTLGGSYIKIIAGDTTINWKQASKINYSDAKIIEGLNSLLIDPKKSLDQKRTIDPEKLIYLMQGFNYQEAAKLENKGKNPNEFIFRYNVAVYPDTLCWMRDFGYSNNEQMAVNYYSSAKYQNHPVVGVSWKQANAFCDWMTKHKIYIEQGKNKNSQGGKCRLPTEAEWEYAATLNEVDATNAKRKQDAADVSEKLFPEEVEAGSKGKLGLYSMADNVSEWTLTSYYEGGESFLNRFNPDIQWGTPDSESKLKRRKIIRGGSWKDIPSLTQPEARSYEDMDAAHSYIGFRVIVNLPQ